MFIFSLYLTVNCWDDFCTTDCGTSEQQVALLVWFFLQGQFLLLLLKSCLLISVMVAPWLYLMELLLSDSRLFTLQHKNVILGYFKERISDPTWEISGVRSLLKDPSLWTVFVLGASTAASAEWSRDGVLNDTFLFHPSFEERFLYTVLSRARMEFWVKYNILVSWGLSASLMNEIKNFSRRLKELQEDMAEHFIWCFTLLFSYLHIMGWGNKRFSQWNINMSAPVH